MCTAPEHRRLGYGAHMLTAAEHLTRMTAYRKLYLHNRLVLSPLLPKSCQWHCCRSKCLLVVRRFAVPCMVANWPQAHLDSLVLTLILTLVQIEGQASNSTVSEPRIRGHQAGLHPVVAARSGSKACFRPLIKLCLSSDHGLDPRMALRLETNVTMILCMNRRYLMSKAVPAAEADQAVQVTPPESDRAYVE